MPRTALPLTRRDFKDVIQRTADEFCSATGLIIRIKSSLLDEAYSCALSTLRFHNITLKKVNQYKVIAHLAYWIHRLQPVRFASPSMIAAVADRILDATSSVSDDKAGLKRSRKMFDAEMRKYRNVSSHYTIFPINEYVAWILIYDEIGVVWREMLDQGKYKDKREVYQLAIHTAEDRYRSQMDELIWSLRYHTYSSRSFSTLVEALFRIEGF